MTSNEPVTLDVPHLGDLLESRGRTWKVYVEGYPGASFLGPRSSTYVRRHVPFLSFKNIQDDAGRCQRIVNATVLGDDIRSGALPDYALYVPDLKHSGHDTGVSAADRWLSETFGPLLRNQHFMENMLFIVTFD